MILEHKPLDSIANIINGYSFKSGDFSANNELKSIKITNVGVQQFVENTDNYLPVEFGEKYSSYLSNAGDIVIALTRTIISSGLKVAIVPEAYERALINQRVAVIRTDESQLLKKYLYYYLASKNAFDYVKGTVNELMQPNLSIKDLKAFSIPLLSLAEQKRIVTILDEVFAGISQAVANTEKNLTNTRELFEIYLNNVFTQKGDGWGEKPINEIASVINGFAFKSGDFSDENTVKSIKITNVGVKDFVVDGSNLLPSDFSKIYGKVVIAKGSIVIALTRSIISSGFKVAVVPAEYDGALLNQRVAGLISKTDMVLSQYLYFYLCSTNVVEYVKKNVNILMQPNLSITDLKSLPVPMPSLATQADIVENLRATEKRVKDLCGIYQEKLNALDELKQSILQKAFTGQLTAETALNQVNG